jgi:hypothetical protein
VEYERKERRVGRRQGKGGGRQKEEGSRKGREGKKKRKQKTRVGQRLKTRDTKVPCFWIGWFFFPFWLNQKGSFRLSQALRSR